MITRRSARRFAASLPFPLLVPLAFALAADGAAFLAGAPAGGEARPPQAGEWLDYVVAYRVDPLEHRLRQERSGNRDPDPIDAADGAFSPFDVPPVWRATPLRLVVESVEETGCRATLIHGGVGREVFLPFAAAMPEYRYDEPPPPAVRGRHRLGGVELPVDIVSRAGPNGGFVRYSSSEVPFGVARFASWDVDVILVEFGTGRPPERHSPFSGIVPPPGELYKP